MSVIKNVNLNEIKPYEKNPRINNESVPKVAESIKQFGFLQPIVCDNDGVILAGHTRFAAAKLLGLPQVPVIYAGDLSQSQAKAYRLADNKVAESSKWDDYFLRAELDDLKSFNVDMSNFGFDDSALLLRRKSWQHLTKRCGLKRKIKQHFNGDFNVTTFYEVGKNGKPINEIKEDKNNVPIFADNLCDYLDRTLGLNIANGNWCILTTPPRRHKTGFHFSTEICRVTSEKLNLPFYEHAFEANNRRRIFPDFTMITTPKEDNVILYDDIITTGQTIRYCRNLLNDAVKVTFCVVGICN